MASASDGNADRQRLSEGSEVVIHGLNERPDLNDAIGRVGKYYPKEDRYDVVLVGSGHGFCLRSHNLNPVLRTLEFPRQPPFRRPADGRQSDLITCFVVIGGEFEGVWELTNLQVQMLIQRLTVRRWHGEQAFLFGPESGVVNFAAAQLFLPCLSGRWHKDHVLLQGWIGNYNGRDWIVSEPMWPPGVDDRLYERPAPYHRALEAIEAAIGPNPNAQGEGEA